jgi:predicted RNase H-like HicB family nuclease
MLTWGFPMKFKIVLYPSDERIAVSVPSLPVYWSQGATREEAFEDIAVAIQKYLESDDEFRKLL